MTKNKTKIILVFLIIALLFSSTFVFADNEDESTAVPISEESETTPVDTNSTEINATESNANAQAQEDSYKKSDVYLTGDNVTIDYIVDGNLFVCANTVTINSQIGGDAFIMAKNLIVNDEAYIFNNLFVMANSVEIKGVVYDAYALANTLTISKGYVYRDLKANCDTLNVNGTVGRNAFVNCSSLNFNTVENSNGVIYGNLEYSSKNEASIPEGAVNGTVNYKNNSDSSKQSVRSIVADYILSLGSFIAFVLIVWLLCLWLAPKFLNNTESYIGKGSLKVFGKGLLGLIAIPVACIILILLQLTSSISLVILSLYILALVVSTSLFTISANNYVCNKLKINKKSGIFGMLIVTAIFISLLTKIPYIGAIISLLIAIFGLGILLTAIIPNKQKKSSDKVEETEVEKIDENK